MSGLDHRFLLLSIKAHPVLHWSRFHNDPRAARVHDDLLHYIADTLKWIPTYNPARQLPHTGLCWYGPTVIRKDGAEVAEKVFTLWAELFACGPRELKLTGRFSWEAENDRASDWYERVKPGSAGYEHLVLNRDEVVGKFRALASYAEEVRRSGGEYYILHLGI